MVALLLCNSVDAHLPIDGIPKSDANQVGWQASAGISLISVPTFLGDNDNSVNVVPDISVSYNDVFSVSLLGGIKYKAYAKDNFEVGPIAKYHFGRPSNGENPFLVAGDETRDLVGLNDVDAAVEFGLFASYNYEHIGLNLEVRNGIGGHRGLVADFTVNFNGVFPTRKLRIIYSVGPKFSYVNRRYLDSFLSVSEDQAQTSGLSEFKVTGGGYVYGLHATSIVPINKNITLIGFVAINQLSAGAANSSLVIERGSKNQAVIGTSLTYSF